ncbi:uncharacterized protein HaLaN_15436 [Haematococcus lacustris]|uniref:Uncharacterized protein n=1 Tax=Haematococcus lacustris TaxID=44745 RepID=A0A699ZIC9_HAELA|nr:uncharacterized protein HaLaN_15436 [Haematococcus lacustris]
MTRHGARVLLVECVCADEATWRARLEQRNALQPPAACHKPASWAELTSLINSYEGCWAWNQALPDLPQLRVDTAAVDIQAAVAMVVHFVAQQCSATGQ